MKVRYLGTAAYDAIPALFCNCETCTNARLLGGKNIRTRSQMLVNDDLLIDFNADTISHYLSYQLDFNKINNCLITHSHSDHFYPEDMAILQYAHNPKVMNFYSGLDGYNKMKKMFDPIRNMDGKYILHLVKPNDRFKAGKYDVLAIKGTHEIESDPLLYAISDGEKKMLYAHDTSIISDEGIRQLKRIGPFNFVSFDCTGGTLDCEWGTHMTFKQVLQEIEIFKKNNLILENTIIVVNHFSHNGRANYDDMVKSVDGKNIIVSYDGLEIEF